MEQIHKMAANAKAWREANPGSEALIVWPQNVLFVGSISDVVKAGVVRHNPKGLELLKALWPWDDESEPTLTMCKVALELSDL